ncbi:DUF4224 domain-containing protein [Salmonella enterica]|nr:DUF4224 domain-containing protein [Salmonella enterica]EGD1632074.1 DUF4224 domain-containing protein [Salmonella enterica]EGI7731634.1 DUF4224 domain-containing protein [Salmonella enterica]EGI9704819.1 DUF4224 domain-containing protein [Salmonella enterica]EGO7037752.1 DUF4224 domain-containing protein [Salmonella enterica]
MEKQLMSDRFLTEEELEDATGASQKSLQKEVLTLNGIYFIERRDGSIRTTWYHINPPVSRLLPPAGYQPVPGMNFDAIES